jgi:hypothetical protein
MRTPVLAFDTPEALHQSRKVSRIQRNPQIIDEARSIFRRRTAQKDKCPLRVPDDESRNQTANSFIPSQCGLNIEGGSQCVRYAQSSAPARNMAHHRPGPAECTYREGTHPDKRCTNGSARARSSARWLAAAIAEIEASSLTLLYHRHGYCLGETRVHADTCRNDTYHH